MELLIPSILFSLSLAASALAADYVADVRLEPTDEDFLTLPFNENHEIHKAPDATMRHPMAFEDGRPVEYAESGLGLSVDLTEFGCDGENVCFKFALEMRELVGWKTDQEWRMPVVSSRAFYSTPASAPGSSANGLIFPAVEARAVKVTTLDSIRPCASAKLIPYPLKKNQ